MANHTENIGVNYCGFIAEKNNWMFRQQPVNDVGIDAHIEFLDSNKRPKQLIALQIKSGPSFFNEQKDGCVIFRKINERQYNYWVMNPLPCIIVLYNPDDEKCIWEVLSKDTIHKTKDGDGDGYFIKIPLNQTFIDTKSNEKLLRISNLPEYVVNYNFLQSQKIFMEIIQNGGTVKLHSFEWINKSSGRGDTELIVDDGDGETRYEYPYWFPYTPYIEVFPRLFPWATFTADADFYEESDIALWKSLNCYYDTESGEDIVVGDSFDEFQSFLKPMRSINHSNEVAEYMLVLGLNELGKAFLEVNGFVSQKQPYAEARPAGGKENEEN